MWTTPSAVFLHGFLDNKLFFLFCHAYFHTKERICGQLNLNELLKMSDFSDAQDRRLVHLACAYQRRGLNISWSEIAKKMKGMSTKKLSNRLKTLQNRHGKHIAHFPSWYFIKSSTAPRKPSRKEKQSSAQVIIAKEPDQAWSLLTAFNAIFQQDVQPSPHSTLLTSTESHEAIRAIFETIQLADVHQKAGETELNVGEITTDSVTKLIRICGITSSDMFVDIGSGVGNVVAQVALESSAYVAVGIEVRASLAKCSKRQLERFSSVFPRLRNVRIHAQDVVNADVNLWHDTTIIYCHNTVFQPATQLFVEQLCCSIPRLKTVILQNPFCSRHRVGCAREFCTVFHHREDPLHLSVAFKSSAVPFHVYFKR